MICQVPVPLLLEQRDVETDLKHWFGPDAEIFLEHYRKLESHPHNWVFSWHWPAFLGGVFWCFARKRYLAAMCWCLIIVGLTRLGLPVILPWLVSATWLALTGRGGLVMLGLSAFDKADQAGLSGLPRTVFLVRDGGRSGKRAWILLSFGLVFIWLAAQHSW